MPIMKQYMYNLRSISTIGTKGNLKPSRERTQSSHEYKQPLYFHAADINLANLLVYFYHNKAA